MRDIRHTGKGVFQLFSLPQLYRLVPGPPAAISIHCVLLASSRIPRRV